MALLLLKRLRSVQLSRRILDQRAKGMEKPLKEELLDTKALGVASAVESGLGYLSAAGTHLNSRVLSLYYALLQFTIAEQVASLKSDADLREVQSKTMHGHGMYNFTLEPGEFPDNFAVALGNTGHFASYLKFLGIKTSEFALPRNPKGVLDVESETANRAIRLVDLFRRIPELRPIIEEHVGSPPLSFHVGFDSQNMVEASAARRRDSKSLPLETESKPGCIIALHSTTEADLDYVKGLDMGLLQDITIATDSSDSTQTHLRGRVAVASSQWHDALPTYKSGACGTSYVVPVFGIHDPYIMHVMLLYGLSILVRYLPDRWREVASGEYDHIRSLIEFYLDVVENVVVLQAVERISGQRVHISQAGSLFGPV